MTGGLVERLKNTNFILRSKMTELNRNENSKQPDQPDTAQQFILTWKWVNRLFNTNVYTSSTEWLFLKYGKLSEKAAKLGSFLRCSAHVLFGYDACLWKTNLRIFCNDTMKNFQVRHGQCDSFPEHFPLQALSNY